MMGMNDHLISLVQGAHDLVISGYYDAEPTLEPRGRWSLTMGIDRHPFFPIISEIKMASPSNPRISPHSTTRLVNDYSKGGAAALSVLTEPNQFGGNLGSLELIRSAEMPVLMTDIIVSERQVEAAARYGVSAILLIQGVFERKEGRLIRNDLIDLAHDLGLEVLLEGHKPLELFEALESEADVIGINQRDMHDLRIIHGHGARVLELIRFDERPIIVMSGLRTRDDIIDVRDAGGDAVSIGTELSSCYDPTARLYQLVVPR